MISTVKTEHTPYKHPFYFIFPEKIAIPLLFLSATVFMLFFLGLSVLASEYHGDYNDIPLDLKISACFLALFAYSMPLFFVICAYRRAKFLRNGGYCVIAPDYIESVFQGKHKRYEYKNRSIKTKQYKSGGADIFIGKSLVDVLKHGPILFTPAFFRAWATLMGFGAPLYRVTNADEVISYLETNR